MTLISPRGHLQHPRSSTAEYGRYGADWGGPIGPDDFLADGFLADGFPPPSTFGAGGQEPYAAALQSNTNVLYLHGLHPDSQTRVSPMNAGRWSAGADDTDRALLAGARGPVLDIGCGPGRMIRAALDEGLDALGVDVSPTAVGIAVEAGLSVLNRSVFDQVPLEGTWATLLLVDGNIGIGGDPDALLARCAALLATDGVLLVEVHHDPTHDLSFEGTIEDDSGRRSASFPWAEIGVDALQLRASSVGLRLAQTWSLDGRAFARFVRA